MHDPNNNYNTSTSTYTAPVNGWYWLSANVRGSPNGNNHRFDIAFYVDGSIARTGGHNQQGVNDSGAHVTTVIYLTTNQQVTVYMNQNTGGSMGTNNSSNIASASGSAGVGRFEGFLLRVA